MVNADEHSTGQAAAPARGPRRGADRRLMAMLAAIAALGSLAIHMMVPALPLLSRDLAVSPQAAQQVVSFYLFGLAAGQLLVGPVIDRVGRRLVLVSGIGIYTVAAALGALSSTPEPLLLARIVQAMGASAGLVASRVIIGDVFGRDGAGRRQAMLMSVVLLSPALAPVLGGLVADRFGWRAVLGLLALAGAIAAAGAVRFIPESRPVMPARKAGRTLLNDYRMLLANRSFVRTSAAIAGGSSALYMFLSLAPFLLVDRWHLDAGQAGLCFLVTAAAGIGGTLVVGWIERRADALLIGVVCSNAGAALAFVLALSGVDGVVALIGPMAVMMAGAGVTAPMGIAAIIHAEEGLAGTATSLSGGVQMAVSGGAATLLGVAGPPSFLLLATGMMIASLFALVAVPRRRPA